MAEHDDPPAGEVTGPTVPRRLSGLGRVAALCAVALVALAGVGGWMGYRLVDERRDAAQQSRFVETARQGAINLTTIRHETVDQDIKRILDSSTGAFHDDFQKRAEPFAEVVRQARSTSEGSVTSAALESHEGDSAQVLVVMSVQMSSHEAPEQVPTVWRMRIGVQQSGDDARVSDVQFVS